MIYFDSAATTLQKPPSVSRASAWAIRNLASPGRGGYGPARRAAETAYNCRKLAAELFDADSPEQVILTFNATHGLNIAIRSLVRPGMTVLISGYEHNAVTRPLAAIRDVTVKTAGGPLFAPERFLEEFRRELTGEVGAVICTHVSNVFGYVLPVERVAELCWARGVPLIIDASQSAGCLPLSMRNTGAAFIAMPGHKGLYGPQGTGLLLCASGGEPVLFGGTGSGSAKQTMPDFLPDRLEAGTHNMAGIAGLAEGLRFVLDWGPEKIRRQEQELILRLGEGLSQVPGIEVFRAQAPENQGNVLSFRGEGRDCEELCERLGDMGYALRAGLHCAPLAHKTAGTWPTGTVRASVSLFNTGQEGERLLRAVGKIMGEK